MIHRWVRFKHDVRSEIIWLTVYADLITNLMLVFLALFGLTIMGNDAIARAVQSMRLSDITSLKQSDFNFEDVGPILEEKFRGASDVRVTEEIGMVRIEFGEQVLFESGRAVLKTAAFGPLHTVANLLKDIPHTIVVEGHTDSIPMQRGGDYRNNWELSLARAMSVVTLLIKEGVPASQLAGAAYGAHHPRSDNRTALGRSLNRRVEVTIFKDFPYGNQQQPRSK